MFLHSRPCSFTPPSGTTGAKRREKPGTRERHPRPLTLNPPWRKNKDEKTNSKYMKIRDGRVFRSPQIVFYSAILRPRPCSMSRKPPSSVLDRPYALHPSREWGHKLWQKVNMFTPPSIILQLFLRSFLQVCWLYSLERQERGFSDRSDCDSVAGRDIKGNQAP